MVVVVVKEGEEPSGGKNLIVASALEGQKAE